MARIARILRIALSVGLLALVACRERAGASDRAGRDSVAPGLEPLRIAYQRSSWPLLALRTDHRLESRLGARASVQWMEMAAGPPIMEALNAGAADLGSVGDAPAVFAKAAGYDFAYVAIEPPKPAAIGVVVPHESTRTTIADLKGARVALQKGSTAHHLLVRALLSVGLGPSDVQPVFVSPADGLAAFQAGRLDAWVVWDPYFSQAEQALGAHALATGEGFLPYYTFYVGRSAFVRDHRELVQQVLESIRDEDESLNTDPAGTARLLSTQAGVDEGVLQRSLRRMRFGVQPMTDEALASQDALRALFGSLGLVPAASPAP